MFSSCYHMGTLFDLRCLDGTLFLLIHHLFYPRTCLKYLCLQNQQAVLSSPFSPPVMEGFGQIALISLPSVSCLPLFLSLPADIDECQVHNGGCQHRCVNTRGSYYCECHPGSRLHVDGRTCLGEEVIFRRPVDLWSLILSQVARLSLDQHKHSKTHTVVAIENSNAHVYVSRNVASPGGATAAAGSPPPVPREAVVCDRQISWRNV